MHVSRSWTLIALAAVVGLLALGNGAALAAESGQDTAAQVVAITVTPEQEGQVALSARFATPGGQALAGQEVGFFLQSDFLGQGQLFEAFLGHATTDDAGVARLRYTPTWDGTHGIVARLAGTEQPPSAEATVLFDVTGSRGIYTPEQPALSQVREWTPFVVGAVVAAVWMVMILTLLRTSLGILAIGRRTETATRRAPLGGAVIPSRLQR